MCSTLTKYSFRIQELGTDVNLYALVFGESVLNDAVRELIFNYTIFCPAIELGSLLMSILLFIKLLSLSFFLDMLEGVDFFGNIWIMYSVFGAGRSLFHCTGWFHLLKSILKFFCTSAFFHLHGQNRKLHGLPVWNDSCGMSSQFEYVYVNHVYLTPTCDVIHICRTLLAVKNHPLETHGLMSAIWSFLEIFVGSLSSGSSTQSTSICRLYPSQIWS